MSNKIPAKVLKALSSIEIRPEVIRVFGRNIYVTYIDAESGMTNLGLTHLNEGIINILNNQHPIEEQDTLLHEVIHIISHLMEIGLDEKQVTVLAHGLIGVFQDNEDFSKYITEKANT